MEPFDQFRSIRRQLDALRPAIEQAQRMHRHFDEALSLSTRVSDILRAYEFNRPLLDAAEQFAAHQAVLQASIQPILIPSFLSELSAAADVWTRVNVGIVGASLLGEVSFDDETAEDDPPESGLEGAIEAKLVEIVPASVLDRLKRVDFAPLVDLDRVLRDPPSMRLMDARGFESFVATLVDELGFEDVVLTPRSNDGGRDVLAKRTVHGIPILFAFECKRYDASRHIGPHYARALLGTIVHGDTRANKGVLVTTSYFTAKTRAFILTEPSLDGKDFDDIVEWLREYGRKGRG